MVVKVLKFIIFAFIVYLGIEILREPSVHLMELLGFILWVYIFAKLIYSQEMTE